MPFIPPYVALRLYIDFTHGHGHVHADRSTCTCVALILPSVSFKWSYTFCRYKLEYVHTTRRRRKTKRERTKGVVFFPLDFRILPQGKTNCIMLQGELISLCQVLSSLYLCISLRVFDSWFNCLTRVTRWAQFGTLYVMHFRFKLMKREELSSTILKGSFHVCRSKVDQSNM